MQRRVTRDLVIATALAAFLSIASAFPRAAVAAGTAGEPHFVSTATDSIQAPCFFRRDWHGGWRASRDARAIYIRVSRAVYRLDLESSYSLLKDPFAILIDKDSANTICTPLDLRLTVSNRTGAVQSPIVKRMTRLTPSEANALPKKLKP